MIDFNFPGAANAGSFDSIRTSRPVRQARQFAVRRARPS